MTRFDQSVPKIRWCGRRVAVMVLVGSLVAAAACGGGGADHPAAAGEPDDSGRPHRAATHDGGTAGRRDGVVVLSTEQLAQVELATVPVDERYLPAQLETTGEVGYEEDRIAHVGPRVPGRVHRVPVSLGDEVRRGQVLVILDSVELGKAKAAYLAARTREELARQTYDRERRLYEDRITSEREMLEARAAHLEAVSMRQSAQEALRLYGIPTETVERLAPGDQDASLLPVTAPIAGRVVEKHATLGELATPEDTLFTVGDLRRVWIWIDVYERDLARVHLGDRVDVVVDPYPDRVFSGEVSYLSPEVASETRTVRARIDAENPGQLLRPGMFAAVRLVDPHTEDGAPSLVVPEGALIRDGIRAGRAGGEALVFVPLANDADGARFEARQVRVGRREGGLVEVVSGLAAGEVVVSEGTFVLRSELARGELGGGHTH